MSRTGEPQQQKNIHLWGHVHPKEALLLPYRQPQKVHWAKTRRGEETLLSMKGEKKLYYHSTSGAIEQAQRECSRLDLEGKELLYFFGVGLGYHYEALEPWLRADSRHHLIFLENDLDVIYYLFQTDRATRLLSDPQVDLYYFYDLKSGQEAFDQSYWDHVLAQIGFAALPLYRRLYPSLCEELQHKLFHESSIKNALVEEYLRYGSRFFKNYYANILYLGSSYCGNYLFGQFPNVPAIICGAGPSLNGSIAQLKELGERALIFSGGSSMNSLCHHNLLPHFGCGIDPNPMQQLRLETSNGFEVPFFYRNRLLHEAFLKIHGPRLHINGAGGYDISDWYEEQLEIESHWLDEGHNVINFCLQIAANMGCNPIIFVGMDLGYTGMRSYAEGIEQKVRIHKKELKNKKDFDEDALLRTDIHGRPLYTLWKWIAESEWIGDFAREHPEITLINATGAGLGFPGVPNIPFEQAVQCHCREQLELRSRIHTQTQMARLPQVTDERVAELTLEMQDSLKRCIEALYTLLEDNVRLQKEMRSQRSMPKIEQGGLAALAEVELSEEAGFTHLLDRFNQVYSRSLNRELRKSQMGRKSRWQKALSRAKINERRLHFLVDVARVNIGMIEIAFFAKKYGYMPTVELAEEIFKGCQEGLQQELRGKEMAGE